MLTAAPCLGLTVLPPPLLLVSQRPVLRMVHDPPPPRPMLVQRQQPPTIILRRSAVLVRRLQYLNSSPHLTRLQPGVINDLVHDDVHHTVLVRVRQQVDEDQLLARHPSQRSVPQAGKHLRVHVSLLAHKAQRRPTHGASRAPSWRGRQTFVREPASCSPAAPRHLQHVPDPALRQVRQNVAAAWRARRFCCKIFCRLRGAGN